MGRPLLPLFHFLCAFLITHTVHVRIFFIPIPEKRVLGILTTNKFPGFLTKHKFHDALLTTNCRYIRSWACFNNPLLYRCPVWIRIAQEGGEGKSYHWFEVQVHPSLSQVSPSEPLINNKWRTREENHAQSVRVQCRAREISTRVSLGVGPTLEKLFYMISNPFHEVKNFDKHVN